ncbi:TetR/AcrR family transcriptional regulator [Rhodovulum sulfidophilum]|uniref:TetR/AcrR family transcriptional regulator n=1 Tax=Rhodovulum sulfidophilum TaxID=35806 RepID=UPI0019210948|nr:TetR/AcrR family transcriptional regulator [Rhodovulum sulfidophilum]MBL3575485.1 TetR/AcrR family transcriptional regulator [Rhodovulum sulfidophilum]MCE8431288.1 TetR/AcrR family transcriptional regulator [Rhodovulum sulfidophilum]MCF4115413.1 TetR/AcrR family transcriptional regulator [Rhodovulum sulfidophilum]
MRYKAKKRISENSGSPRTKPAEVRLDELMSAAERLFLSQGVEATTVNEIVEAASVAKGTFYHYFSSKNEILEALAKRYTERFLRSVQEAIDDCSPDDWEQRLRIWIHANIETYVKTYRTHDIVYTAHHHHNRANQAKSVILDQLMEIIEGGRLAGVWAPDQPKIVALLIYSGVHGAADDIIASKTADCTSFAQNVSNACLYMLPRLTAPKN